MSNVKRKQVKIGGFFFGRKLHLTPLLLVTIRQCNIITEEINNIMLVLNVFRDIEQGQKVVVLIALLTN